MIPRLEAVHPVLAARDVGSAVAFYEALGFTCLFLDDEANPRYAVIRRDGVELHLQWQEGSQFDGSRDRPVYRFEVSDVDALYEQWRSSGALHSQKAESPWKSPGDTPWSTREFHLRDPGGNGLQFYRTMKR